MLTRVSEGEVIGVTNNGKLAAVLTPPATRELERARLPTATTSDMLWDLRAGR